MEDIFEELAAAWIAYEAGVPIMSDAEFDAKEVLARLRNPKHEYFTGAGTAAKGEKVKLVNPMGSLDQVYEEKDFHNWAACAEWLDVAAKYDGVSIGIEYIDGEFTRAYTRGDGYEGEDKTDLIRRHPRVPETISVMGRVELRGEVIMRKSVFEELKASGAFKRDYKNPRNYVAGQVNRSEADDTFVNNVDVVIFTVVEYGNLLESELADIGLTDIDHQLMLDYFANTEGFTIAENETYGFDWDGESNIEAAERYLKEYKEKLDYELDGVVISVSNTMKRAKYDNGSLNPKWAVKFKVNAEGIQTKVKRVEWNVSKHGFLKPRVEVEPIEIGGVTISYATGFNAQFIVERGIGVGAEIVVARNGDVIPYIERTVTRAEPDMPSVDEFGEYDWNETRVDLLLKNATDAQQIKQNIDFFESIDAPQLRAGSINTLHQNGFKTIADIIKMTENQMVDILGKNGYTAYSGLKKCLNPIAPYVLAGSSQCFGRGMGKRKFKVLFDYFGTVTPDNYEDILKVEGFDVKSRTTLVEGYPAWFDFIKSIEGYFEYATVQDIEGELTGQGFCFTGVRDKALEQAIIAKGGSIESSVNKKTTHLICVDPEGKSAKLEKARKQGVTLLSHAEAKETYL